MVINVKMGRTRRKRKKKHLHEEGGDLSKVINLQKSLRLKCTNIQVDYFNGIGWGVRSKRKIDEGEIIISLPLHYLITPDVQCDIFHLFTTENEPPQFLLSIFLVYEFHKGNHSEYFDYIESLPKTFTNLYFCTKYEIELLPDFMRQELLSQSNFIEKFFFHLLELMNDKLCPHCGATLRSVYSRDNFIRAWFIVNTRSVYYEDEKNRRSLALAPFLDLFNHSDRAITKMSIDFEKKLYTLRTLVKYKKFEQVFIKYGSHSNLKLLLEYGFILPDNMNDFVEFSFKEVVDTVKEFDPRYGEITKSKYNFIRSHKLNQCLTKSTEFSWSFNGLISVLTTADQNLFLTLQSNAFNSDEKTFIKKISDTVSEKKHKELEQNLLRMDGLDKCTESFQLAKKLIKIYMSFLS